MNIKKCNVFSIGIMILFVVLLIGLVPLGILARDNIIGWKYFWIDIGILALFACVSEGGFDGDSSRCDGEPH